MGRPPAASSAQRPGPGAARATGSRPPARPQSCARVPMTVCPDPELAVPGPQTRPGATEAAATAGVVGSPCAPSFLGSGVGLGVPLKSYCLNVLIAEIITRSTVIVMNKQRHFYFKIKLNCCRAAARREGVTGARDPARGSRSRPCVKQGEDPERGRREGTGTERPGQLPAARLPPGTCLGPRPRTAAPSFRRRSPQTGGAGRCAAHSAEPRLSPRPPSTRP